MTPPALPSDETILALCEDLALAAGERISPAVAADRIAEERIRSVGRLRSIWVG